MAKCSIENWKMKDIVTALKTMSHNGKKIVIPRFQRGKRWSETQELSFIDSLKNGYPVGTLLFYRTNEIENGLPIEVYTLVDGLQRSTAISRYLKNPMKYFEKTNISNEMLIKIYNILGFENQKNTIIPKIEDIYFEFITHLKTLDGENSFALANKIVNEIATIKDKMQIISELMGILPDYLLMCKSDYETIAETEIPAVVYTGDEEDLPEIFARINSKGTPLNSFEIYAASWPQSEKYEVRNEKIIEHVLKKYDTLNDDIYTIRGYDRSEISQNKKLTIFEYVFGFSKWLNEEFSILAFELNNKPDEISTIGFELLDACLFDSKNIGEIHKELKLYNINKLEKRIVEAIKFVENIIKPIIKFKSNSRKDDRNFLYAKNQILAMIAFVFREKYNIKNLAKEKDSWHNNEAKLRKQLYDYFIFDIIRKEWYEGGGKLHTIINSKRYYDEISPSTWEITLNSMFEDSLKKKEIKSVRTPSNIDLVFLNIIYLNKFSALDQLSAEKFDIEHIATKDLLKRLINDTCPNNNLEGLPIGSIANLCYLPEYQNRSKGNKTFYQDKTYLRNLSIEDIEEKYSFTTKQQLEWTDMDYEKGDFNILYEFYLNYLKERFGIQKKHFYQSMNIDSTKINKLEMEKLTQLEITHKNINNKVMITDVESGQAQYILYNNIKNALEKKFSISLKFEKRTTVSNNSYRFILAYSKLYLQGKRHKYWFAYHPQKIKEGNQSYKYYVFACNDDKISFSFPLELLEKNKEALNKSKNKQGNYYYHIVIFIDIDNIGNKKMTWLLSRPQIREINIEEYLIN